MKVKIYKLVFHGQKFVMNAKFKAKIVAFGERRRLISVLLSDIESAGFKMFELQS